MEITTNKCTVYVAGPLFSIAEKNFNILLIDSLSKEIPEITFILPQKYAEEISGQKHFFEDMFKYCLNSIDRSDTLLCILDGPDIDSGTALEMGYAYANNKPIIGVRSDFRNSEEKGVNLMISRVCTEILWLPTTQFCLTDIISRIVSTLKCYLK